jgi:hypothetical protein
LRFFDQLELGVIDRVVVFLVDLFDPDDIARRQIDELDEHVRLRGARDVLRAQPPCSRYPRVGNGQPYDLVRKTIVPARNDRFILRRRFDREPDSRRAHLSDEGVLEHEIDAPRALRLAQKNDVFPSDRSDPGDDFLHRPGGDPFHNLEIGGNPLRGSIRGGTKGIDAENGDKANEAYGFYESLVMNEISHRIPPPRGVTSRATRRPLADNTSNRNNHPQLRKKVK